MPITEKGKKMAQNIAEFFLMKYFFPRQKIKALQARYCEDFMKDMQFNLKNSQVTRATHKLNVFPNLVGLVK